MRALTYNIHKGIGGRDRLYRLERIIEVIEHENPDLMCLQEVDRNVRRSKYHDQPRLLADYFNAAAKLYQLNVHLTTGGYGNLILSRWPMRSHHQVSLRLGQRKPRGAQMAVIETPEGPLHLINWHLGLAEGERHWQVQHVLEHHLFKEAAGLPTLVIGDCNDWRDTLRRRFVPAGFSEVTTPPSRFRTFPAWMAMGSLDKAWVRGDIRIRNAYVVHTIPARVASDHRPLVVDFHLGATPLEQVLGVDLSSNGSPGSAGETGQPPSG